MAVAEANPPDDTYLALEVHPDLIRHPVPSSDVFSSAAEDFFDCEVDMADLSPGPDTEVSHQSLGARLDHQLQELEMWDSNVFAAILGHQTETSDETFPPTEEVISQIMADPGE